MLVKKLLKFNNFNLFLGDWPALYLRREINIKINYF